MHELLFAFLRTLPNDGTFNQDASFQRCVEKVKLYGCSFGFDLSAATDRLPIAIQVSLITSLFSYLKIDTPNKAATYWSDILVSRDYTFNYDPEDPDSTPSIKYAVGQPMGALSS